MTHYLQTYDVERFLTLLHERNPVSILNVALKPDTKYVLRNGRFTWSHNKEKVQVNIEVDVTCGSWIFLWPTAPGEDAMSRVHRNGLRVSGSNVNLSVKSGDEVKIGDATVVFEVKRR
ncbi:hypothetical protein HYFRA_00003702 [Hymenoscyphus fraxineus]|uniref:Uncharacterized protein n=1 Tax=Hymenoscyphus fraxineus TaxID=746836 RepID=A0A9N9L3G8_9HELO|nr:hypothetical protein HYFRA_00003702 [Hymenoscyphus fraxineus]